MKKIKIIIFLKITILFLLNPVNAEYLDIKTDKANIFYEKPLNTVANEVKEILPDITSNLENTLKLKLNSTPRIYLIRGTDNFRKITNSDLIVAYAVPENNSIYIDTSRVFSKPFTLKTTLKHELCHLILHQNIENTNLPRWFDEGVCQWTSDGISEIISDINNPFVEKAILSNNLFKFNELYKFPEDTSSVILAYWQSKNFIEYILKKYGKDSLTKIIKNLSSRKDINESFEKAISINLYELENEWRSHLKIRHTWFIYLSNNIYTIIFVLLSFLTIYGFYRLIKSKRKYSDEDEPPEPGQNI